MNDPVANSSRTSAVDPIGDGGAPNEAAFDVAAGQPMLSEKERRVASQKAFWLSIAALLRWRGMIAGITLVVAVLAVVISLRLPLWYEATARVMPPESGGGGGLSSLIGGLSPIASSLLGSGGSDYSRYLAILNSRSMRETLIERFDLIEVYDNADHEDPMSQTMMDVDGNVSIEVDMETSALTISVLDRTPTRAAQMANFMVDELNERNEALALEGASRFRNYVEERYRQIELAMDSAQTAMTRFQQRNGVVELPSMVQGAIEAAAAQQAVISQLEIEHQALLSELGPENSRTIATERALETARAAQRRLLGGQEQVLPISMAQLPRLSGEYARLYQDLLIQKTLMEEARPLLEQARFDEERDRVAVQVLDPAVPPVRKAKPKRAFIVLAATGSAFALTVILALLVEGYRRRRPMIMASLAAARARS